MKFYDHLRNFFSNQVLSPKVDQAKLEEQFQAIREQLPVPVFWLLGKAQSGKTSIIRSLTGSSRAEIGDGIRPCTRNAYLYDFPSEANSFVRFLDTRGLGEVDYDPTEDMEVFAQQAHLLIVVVKAMDHAQQAVMEPLRKIIKKHPQWPILVVQTTLHEGYSPPEMAHLEPYPYQQDPLPNSVPSDLSRSLSKQRELFQDITTDFIPVDLTLPEDGYDIEHYGLDALWDAIETKLPLGLRVMLQDASPMRKHLKGIYFKTAHPHILFYSIMAGSTGLVPVPFVGLPLTGVIMAKMFQTIASIYNQEMNTRRFTEIVGALGVGVLANFGGRELIKFVPVYGSAVSSVYTAATTYALGQTLCAYFSYVLDGDLPSKEKFRELYKEQLEEGREVLKQYFRNFQSPNS